MSEAALADRLVFALLRPAVRVAASFGLSLPTLGRLLELAYFDEQRQRHPRDMKKVANDLGVSLRTAATLSKLHKQLYLVEEAELAEARRITEGLATAARPISEVATALHMDREVLDARLARLGELGWVRRLDDDRVAITDLYRNFKGDTLGRRLDGLHNQLDVLTVALWKGFVEPDTEDIHTRTWVFHADPTALQAMVRKTVLAVRHDAVDLEEHAFASGTGVKHGMTLSVTPMETS